MTIRVSVKNEDSRETAVISVQTQSQDGGVVPWVGTQELKGGESAEVYVHSTQQILVKELRQ